MNEPNLKKYKEFEIISYSSGFQISPVTMIRIASFIVRKDRLISVFAFSDGGISLRMAHSEIKDENLLVEAEEIIKRFIDDDKVKHLEEYTFEFQPTNFINVNNPRWWIKSLRNIYGE